MNPFRISFFGHRDVEDLRYVEARLEKFFVHLCHRYSDVECLLGRSGEFDMCVARMLRTVRRRYDARGCLLLLVLPYKVRDMEALERYYDEVFIPETVEGTHYKRAISARNRWMIEQSDLVVVFVNKSTGGACQAMQYAVSCGKRIINLAEADDGCVEHNA